MQRAQVDNVRRRQCFFDCIRHMMPRELKNATAIDYLYYALLPGKLFPRQRPRDPLENFRSFSELYRPADVSVFSAMDRALYTKFRKALWTDNTWIIRSGNP